MKIILFYSEPDRDIADTLRGYLAGSKDFDPVDFHTIVDEDRHIDGKQCIFVLIVSGETGEIDVYAAFLTAKRFNAPLVPLLFDITKEEYHSCYGQYFENYPHHLIRVEQVLPRDTLSQSLDSIKCVFRSVTKPEEIAIEKIPISPQPYVFISVKRHDYEIAKKIYKYLEDIGIQVFLAPSGVLDKKGCANYAKQIDRELERATHLLLIISNPKDIQSGWVEYEWFTYHYEMTSERKKDGSLHIITIDKTFDDLDLPIRLRGIQQTVFNLLDLSVIGKKIRSGTPLSTNTTEIFESDQGPTSTRRTPSEQTNNSNPERSAKDLIQYKIKNPFILIVSLMFIVFGAIILIDHQPIGIPGSSPTISPTTMIVVASPIQIIFTPPLSSSAQVVGTVDRENITGHNILVYIKVKGFWWGPKPGWEAPFTKIEADGTWRCNIFTGGEDHLASEVAAVLVPSTLTTAPEARGVEVLPYEVSGYPFVTATR